VEGERFTPGIEKYLWPDFTYLTFHPSEIPVSARIWGYFFMLSVDTDLWRDNYALGIGPDPDKHWYQLYATEKPDVIRLTDEQDFLRRRDLLLRRQRVDIGWLWEAMQYDYHCIYHERFNALRMYLRRDLVGQIDRTQWRFCQPGTMVPPIGDSGW
jgi:hypothetical protein